MNKYLSTTTLNFQWLGIKGQRHFYAEILTESLILNGLKKKINSISCRPKNATKKPQKIPTKTSFSPCEKAILSFKSYFALH